MQGNAGRLRPQHCPPHWCSTHAILQLLRARRRLQEDQGELLERVNQATLQHLNRAAGGLAAGGGTGKKITDIVAYKSPVEMAHNGQLAVQVRSRGHAGAAMSGRHLRGAHHAMPLSRHGEAAALSCGAQTWGQALLFCAPC